MENIQQARGHSGNASAVCKAFGALAADPYVPQHGVGAYAYESLGGTPEGILTLRALKAEPVSELLTDWIWDETLLPQISGDGLERLLRYILNSDVDASAFLRRTRRIQTQPLNAKTMTLADRLVEMGREEGRSEGLSQGISQGLSQGETVAMRRAVIRALEASFKQSLPAWWRPSNGSMTMLGLENFTP